VTSEGSLQLTVYSQQLKRKAKNYAEFTEKRRGTEVPGRKNPPFAQNAKDGAPSSTWVGRGEPEKTQRRGRLEEKRKTGREEEDWKRRGRLEEKRKTGREEEDWKRRGTEVPGRKSPPFA
jgi:hypothetical protein